MESKHKKISRGDTPRLIFLCPVPTGSPHRSHCVPMNINPCDSKTFAGPSVIIGFQKTQIYQRFTGSQQEVFILKLEKICPY